MWSDIPLYIKRFIGFYVGYDIVVIMLIIVIFKIIQKAANVKVIPNKTLVKFKLYKGIIGVMADVLIRLTVDFIDSERFSAFDGGFSYGIVDGFT